MAIKRVLLAAWLAVLVVFPATARQARFPVGPAGQGWVVDRADLAANVTFEPHLGRDAMAAKSPLAVYSGINGWESRTPGFASFVDARFESVVLPLRAGQNEVVLAVSDDQRFGWGFALRIDDATGVKF
jgi:hypothetical protein